MTLPIVEAIPSQMELLFEHLIGNALKFAHPHRQSDIIISAKKLSNNNIGELDQLDKSLLHYEILISDNGIGFSQEFAKQIFVIFRRLNDQREYPGTGIGLALCSKIVAHHNGEIYATSQEGRGSAFHIILPARQ
jgi:signal transduction histidine kinase